ncbi:MAG: hypothetical protein K2M44_05880, partial [Clostridia bacterium]|nr:hypothetical protein [Clostridia bacterium]
INMFARCAEDMFFLLGETLGVIDCIGGSGRADGQTCGDSGKANAIAGDSECRDADTCACGSRGKTCNTCDKTCNTCDKTCGTCDKTCDTCGDVCGGGACGGKDKDCSCNIGCAHTVASNSDAALQERTDSDRRRQ